jgi:hypothetical protein
MAYAGCCLYCGGPETSHCSDVCDGKWGKISDKVREQVNDRRAGGDVHFCCLDYLRSKVPPKEPAGSGDLVKPATPTELTETPRPEITALAKSFIKDYGGRSQDISAAELKNVLTRTNGSSPGVVPVDTYDSHVEMLEFWPQIIDHGRLAVLLESIAKSNEVKHEQELANKTVENAVENYEKSSPSTIA